jgi:hypothetical protein
MGKHQHFKLGLINIKNLKQSQKVIINLLSIFYSILYYKIFKFLKYLYFKI